MSKRSSVWAETSRSRWSISTLEHQLFDAMGPEAAEVLNPKDVKSGWLADLTHLTPKGGELMADLVVRTQGWKPFLAKRLD